MYPKHSVNTCISVSQALLHHLTTVHIQNKAKNMLVNMSITETTDLNLKTCLLSCYKTMGVHHMHRSFDIKRLLLLVLSLVKSIGSYAYSLG